MLMSETSEVFGRAEALEKGFEWLKAVELYEQGLSLAEDRDFARKGETQEKIGHCFHRAAMQAESKAEFKEKMQRAIEAYEEAEGFYEKTDGEEKNARILRSEAITKYLGYWLTPNPAEKRKLLDECLELESKALKIFSETQDMSEYGKMYNSLSLVFFCRFFLEWDRQIAESIVKRGVEWGEKAVGSLSEVDNLREIFKTYFTLASCLDLVGFFIQEPEEQDKNRLKVVKFLNKTVDISEKGGDAYLSGLSYIWLGTTTGDEEAVKHFDKALEFARLTRDNFSLAYGLDCLAYITYWEALAIENLEKKKELAEKAMQFYDEARYHSSIISFTPPRRGLIGPPAGHSEHYFVLGMWETDPEKRLELLEKSEKTGIEALNLARKSDMPRAVSGVLHVVSKTLRNLAFMETEHKEKRSLLERALQSRKENIEITEKVAPFDYWNLGVYHDLLAEVKIDLADIERDIARRRELLEDAVLSKDKCLQLSDRVMPYYEKMGVLRFFSSLRRSQDTYATLLLRLFDLANKPEYLRKAIEISKGAIESAGKLDIVSRMAESHWKIAKTYDVLGEHAQAAEHFAYASEEYLQAAESIPQLKGLYQDLASYMQAWIEIEKARNHHIKQQYGLAREHYENAANLHGSTERWKYLRQNYLAWSRLEEAEDLSRREQTEQARTLFQQAANLFVEAKSAVKTKFENITLGDEREMAARLLDASDIRHEYCLARTTIEDAKISDRQGDYATSAEKYGEATERFRKIMEAAPEQTRRELQPILCLCQAWQKMMMAEAKASSVLYAEAAELFKQAKEHTVDRSTSLVASANSSFCKSLEAGAEFEAIRDVESYSTAKKHMEAAAECYLKAGYENASEYARATNKVFDAYMFMHKAETETEPLKRAQYYKMAEEVLQASANLFTKAKYAEKSKEVRRLLESVKEEHQLAVSLADVLHAPTVAATTTSFSTPTPTYEKAVGLERFEHADVQANLILSVREAKVGEDVDLEIELVNAGKAPALLVKVQEAIPDAFRIERAPDIYRVEGCNLNMKGKRLDSLKTEEVKMVVKPISKGTFTLRPKVLYMDENGECRFHEPEPTSITVKELGIKGWIKG
jgi:autonomous glycyl radical cofactor GrcA